MSTEQQKHLHEADASVNGSRGSGRSAQFIMLVFALMMAGCGSRYDHADWPESPFPDQKEFLELGSFGKLKYYKERPPSFDGLQIRNELLADGKFEFEACLMFFSPVEGKKSDQCPKAVTFQSRYPVSDDNFAMGIDFLGAFEKSLKTDLADVREAYAKLRKEKTLNRPYTQIVSGFVVEVCAIHQVTRGDFLVVGVYEKSYYDRVFRLH